MTDYYIVWHDVEDYEPRRTFEMIKTAPEKLSPEDKSVPAMAGLKTMYIRWHRRQFGQDQIYLVTYTNYQIKPQEIETLLDGAINFILRQSQIGQRHGSPVAGSQPRNHDPERSKALHSELVRTLVHFLANHPDTLKSEVLAALETTRLAYQHETYHRWE
jgi:hypothetical protein